MPNKFLGISRPSEDEIIRSTVKVANSSFASSCDIDKPKGTFCCIYRDKDDPDAYVTETRVFDNTPPGIEKALAWILSSAALHHTDSGLPPFIIESTGMYRYLTLHLFEGKLDCTVVNPSIVKSMLRVEGKADVKDAQTLAKLLLSFDLWNRRSNIASSARHTLMKLLRLRRKAIQQRTTASNRIGSILTENNVPLPNAVKIFSQSGMAMLEAIIAGEKSPDNLMLCWRGAHLPAKVLEKVRTGEITFKHALDLCLDPSKEEVVKRLREIYNTLPLLEFIPDPFRKALGRLRDDLIHFDLQQAEYDTDIESALDSYEVVLKSGEIRTARETIELLKTVPLFGHEVARVFIAEAGLDFTDVYANSSGKKGSDKLVRALGLAPSNTVSGGKVIGRGVESGNRHFKPIIAQAAANFLRSIDPPPEHRKLHDWGRTYQSRSDAQHARIAVASKAVRAAYYVVLKWEPYSDAGYGVQDAVVTQASKRVLQSVGVLERNLANQGENIQRRADVKQAHETLGRVLGLTRPRYRLLAFTTDLPIEELGLGKRATNALTKAGLPTVASVVLRVLSDTLIQTQGIGERTLQEIEETLVAKGYLAKEE